MENKREKSLLNKNWLWMLLIALLLLLGGKVIIGLIKDKETTGPGQWYDPPPPPPPPPLPPPPGSNIIDPTPVYKDSAFTFALIEDNPGFKKSYFIDGKEICKDQKICKAKISTLGKHTLKICTDDLKVCDTLSIEVLPLDKNAVDPQGGKLDKTREKGNENDSQVKKESTTPPKDIDTDGDGVVDLKDNCPRRKGSKSNGCPDFYVQIPAEGFIDENFEVKIGGDDILASDNIDWQTGTGIQKVILGKNLEATGSVVGKYSIAAEITNPDAFNMSVQGKTIHLKIRNSTLSSLFKPMFIYGSAISSKSPSLAALKSNSDAAKNQLKKHILGGNLSGANIYDRSGGLVNDLDTFINADILGGIIKGGLNIAKIEYDKSTGKVTQIHLQ